MIVLSVLAKALLFVLMAWTAPRTWVAGELVTAAMLNTHLRDNFNALRAALLASTATGAQNNWNPGITGHALIAWSGASALAVTGFSGGTVGDVVVFRNTGSQIATFAHASGSSAVGNRLTNTATSAPTPVAAGGHARWVHDGTSWVMVEHEQGAWITPTFAAGNYVGSGSLTWTVEAGDVTVQRYRLDGRTVTMLFDIATSSTGGTAAASLVIGNGAWGGFTLAVSQGRVSYSDNGGTWAIGHIGTASTSSVALSKVDFSTWSNAATNATAVSGLAVIEVT